MAWNTLKIGVGRRRPHTGWEFPAWRRGRLEDGVSPWVTLEKGPKGLQNHWNSIRFFTKSEQVKTLLEGPESGLAKCPRNRWFAQGFGLEEAKKPFSSRSRKRRVRWSKMVSFFTFGELLSRNASFFALKRLITFICVLIFEKWQNPDAKTSYTCEKVASVSFFTFFTNY